MLDEREGPVPPQDLPRAFNRQSVYKRFAIVLAGPLFNFILAILVYWVLFMHGVPGSRPVVDAPLPATPAAVAGFENGDTLTAIDGRPVRTWEDVRIALVKHAVARNAVDVQVRTDSGDSRVRRLDLSGMRSEQVNSDFLDAVGLAPLKGGPRPVMETILAGRRGREGRHPSRRSHRCRRRREDLELGRAGQSRFARGPGVPTRAQRAQSQR